MSFAKWVRKSHQIPLTLTANFYTSPIQILDGWLLIKNTNRVGVYKKGDEYIVVCKGTTVTHVNDLLDDARIAGLLSGQNTLEIHVRNIVKNLDSKKILMTGHSLGGRVALSIAKEFKLQAVVFNPAAPFISPLTDGPGPDSATVYHIVGDAISSHASIKAAEIIRVDLNYSVLQTVQAHAMTNFTTDLPVYGFKSVDQEDLYQHSNLALAAWALSDRESLRESRDLYKRIASKPLPDSLREQDKSDTAAILKTGYGILFFLDKIGQIDTEIKLVQEHLLGVKPTGLHFNKHIQKVQDARILFNLGRDAGENLVSLGHNLKNIRVLDSAMDYINLKSAVDKFNEEYAKQYGKKLKVSDVMLESPRTPLLGDDIYAKADLQMIGIEDEALAKVNFSARTPEPSAYLKEVADKFNDSSKEMRAVHAERLDWIENPAYESKFKTRVFPNRSFKSQWQYNPIYVSKEIAETPAIKQALRASVTRSTSLLATKSVSASKTTLLRMAALAGKTAGKVFAKIVPILAAVDLAYTVYLFVKGIVTNDFNEVVEHVTGISIEDWKFVGDYVAQGPVEYYRDYFMSIRPSCERCPPGGPLAWNGETCVYNPCGKRSGKWGVWDNKTNQCTYPAAGRVTNIDLAHPGWNIYPRRVEEQGVALAEQKAAMDDFMARKQKYDELTLYQEGDSELRELPLKRQYRAAYQWNECPK